MTYSPSGSGSSRISTATDAAISAPTDKQFLQYNASTQKWTNHTLVPADVSGFDAYVNNLIAASGTGSGGGTTTTVPTVPTNVSAAAASSTSVTLTWAAPSSTGGAAITGYTVNYTGGTAHTVSASTLTYTFTGLTASTAYHCTVVATNSVGSSPTGTATATTSAASVTVVAPGAPTNVQATVNGTTATLTWAAPSSTGGAAISGYTVARDGVDSNGSGVYSTTTAANVFTQVFNNLVAGTTYHLTVAATNSAGTGPTGTASAVVASSGGTTGGGGTTTSGLAMPVGNLPGWTQIVAEDFNDAVPVGGFVADNNGALTSAGSGYSLYRNRFTTYPDGWTDTSGGATYYPSKTLSMSNSCADIYLHSESISGSTTALSATLNPSLPNNAYFQTYGRYSYRMRATMTGSGYGCVTLLINSNDWPANGEMDWPEGDVSGGINGFYHYADANGGQLAVSGQGANWSDWHTYTMEWMPNSMKWYVDNQVVLNTTDRVPSRQTTFLLQSGSNGSAPASNVSGHIQVDWMTVYSYTP